MIDRAEFVAGLAASREYLLSHHLPGERYRCYSPRIFGHDVHLCARCSGIYPGIVGGVVAALLAPLAPATSLWVVATFPVAALVDWAATTFTDRRGTNHVRTATGAMLGYAYGIGLVELFLRGELAVFAIGVGYGIIAVLLLAAVGWSRTQ